MRISGTLPVVWVVTGMPVKHAFLSPSSAERWYHCPPSAWLCEQFPDLGSVFASEGTEAHSLCEFLLRQKLGQAGLVDPRPSLQYYTSEMEECCQGYVQYVSEIVEDMRNRGSSPAVYVEQRVDLRRFIPESMGTSDCVIVGGDEICIVDFKYGMYPVPASSLQLRIYALGACEMLSALDDFDKVRMVVYQPRLSNVDDCSMSVVELYAWLPPNCMTGRRPPLSGRVRMRSGNGAGTAGPGASAGHWRNISWRSPGLIFQIRRSCRTRKYPKCFPGWTGSSPGPTG